MIDLSLVVGDLRASPKYGTRSIIHDPSCVFSSRKVHTLLRAYLNTPTCALTYACVSLLGCTRAQIVEERRIDPRSDIGQTHDASINGSERTANVDRMNRANHDAINLHFAPLRPVLFFSLSFSCCSIVPFIPRIYLLGRAESRRCDALRVLRWRNQRCLFSDRFDSRPRPVRDPVWMNVSLSSKDGYLSLFLCDLFSIRNDRSRLRSSFSSRSGYRPTSTNMHRGEVSPDLC